MVFFPRLDRQKALDVVQTFNGKKVNWDSHVTYTACVKGLCSSVGSELELNKHKQLESSSQLDNCVGKNDILSSIYNSATPPKETFALLQGYHHRKQVACVQQSNACKNTLFTSAMNKNKEKSSGSSLEEKRFQCENCHAFFINSNNLQRHIRHFHVGARSHPCPECGKAFATSSGLKQHKHIHSSVKPFTCKICHKSYTQFSNLCRHKRMNEGCRTKTNCQKCGQQYRKCGNNTNKLCTSCRDKEQKKNSFASTKQSKSVHNKLSTVVKKPSNSSAAQQKETSVSITPGDHPCRKLEDLCSSVEGTLKPLPSSLNAARKRSWENNFLENKAISTTSTGKLAKRVSDMRSQCSFEPSTTIKEPNNSNFNNKDSNQAQALVDVNQPDSNKQKSNLNVQLRVGSSAWSPHLSPNTTSSNLSTLPSKKRFLQRSSSNAAAAAVAAAYVYRSSLEKKPESFSICNNKQRQLRFSETIFSKKSPNSAKRIANLNPVPQEEPLDLSIKSAKSSKFDNKKLKNSCSEEPQQTSTWKESLNFLYRVGQQYGNSFFPPTYSYLIKSDNDTSLLEIPPANAKKYEATTWNPNYWPLYPFSKPPHNLTAFTDTTKLVSQQDSTPLSPPGFDSDFVHDDNVSAAQIEHSKSRHACSFCFKNFPRNANLTRHVRTHTGEQPYTCKYCNKSFSVSSNMQRHIKKIHLKEKSFPSVGCGQQLGQQTNLERHLRNHEKQAWNSFSGNVTTTENGANECATKLSQSSSCSNLASSLESQSPTRRMSSGSSNQSFDSATPFRPWKHAALDSDNSFVAEDEGSSGSPILEFADFYNTNILNSHCFLKHPNESIASLCSTQAINNGKTLQV